MKRNSSPAILAATLGWCVRELSEYRYKSTRTKQPIYSIGERFFTVGATIPKDDVGWPWKQYKDQFWASKNNTVLWVSEKS